MPPVREMPERQMDQAEYDRGEDEPEDIAAAGLPEPLLQVAAEKEFLGETHDPEKAEEVTDSDQRDQPPHGRCELHRGISQKPSESSGDRQKEKVKREAGDPLLRIRPESESDRELAERADRHDAHPNPHQGSEDLKRNMGVRLGVNMSEHMAQINGRREGEKQNVGEKTCASHHEPETERNRKAREEQKCGELKIAQQQRCEAVRKHRRDQQQKRAQRRRSDPVETPADRSESRREVQSQFQQK